MVSIKPLKLQSMFPQLWNILEILQVCTVHFYWMKHTSPELHLSAMQFTWVNQLPIILSENFEQELFFGDQRLDILQTMTQTDMRKISQLYSAIFNSSKFSTVCTINFPVLDGIANSHLETFFQYIADYQYFIRHNDKLDTATYVILPLLINPNIFEVNINMYGFVPPSNIILISKFSNLTFVPCPPINQDCWTGENLRWNVVNPSVPYNYKTSFQNILFTKASKTITKLDIVPFETFNCAYSRKSLQYTVFASWFSPTRCTKLIVSDLLNCTSSYCKYLVFDVFGFGVFTMNKRLLDKPFEFPLQHFSALCSQFHGIRYSVFINKWSEKDNLVDYNVLHLLSPFSNFGWVVLIFTLLLLGCTLKVTGMQNSACYWFFGTVLEQEDDKSKWKNLHNWYLIILWLYTCHLIRCVYTSSLYTYMTKESDPSEVPKSFNDLIYNKSMQLLVESTSTYKNTIASVRDKKFELKRVSMYSSNLSNIFTLSVSKFRDHEKYLNNGEFIAGTNDLKMFQNSHNFSSVFYTNVSVTVKKILLSRTMKLDRFAWIYETKELSSLGHEIYTNYTSLNFKLLLMMYGEYTVIENTDSVVDPRLFLWYSKEINYLREICSTIIGSLFESGIYLYQNHYWEIFTQRKALDDFVKISGFDHQWNWFSLVNQMVSKHIPLGWYSSTSYGLANSLLQSNQSEATGAMKDFRYVWIVYGCLSLLTTIGFLLECILYNVSKKLRERKNNRHMIIFLTRCAYLN